MTSGLAVPRVALSASPNVGGARTPNLPVIEHPMAKLGNKNELTVRGSSSLGRHADQGMANGHHHGQLRHSVDLGVRSSASPPNKAIRASVDGISGGKERLIHWPPDETRARVAQRLLSNGDGKPLTPYYLVGPRGARTRTKPDSSSLTRRNTFEVLDIVKDKLTTGFAGLKHLFKANDPTGQGNDVSREALQRILFSFCGYVSPEQYNQFLKKLGLDGRDTISFDSFVGCFCDNEAVKKQWVSPIQKIEVEKANRRKILEEGLRATDLTVPDPYLSAPFSDAILRDKIKTMDDARRVFPAACFGPSGMIVPPQLREAYAQCGVYMIDRDFNTLWQRYDREGIGAIWTEKFLKTIGVNTGRPRTFNAKELPKPKPHESLQRPKSENITKGLVKSSEHVEKQKKPSKDAAIATAEKAKMDTANDVPQEHQTVQVTVVDSTEEVKKADDTTTEESKVKIPKKTRQQHPKLDNIIDCLHYRFEESYNAMLTAYQLFDYMSDNYVSRVDFRRILQEFGFNISITEMDSFLARIGVRSIRSQINYREFLNKFQSKADNSITSRIVTNQYHMFQNDAHTQLQNGLNAEELEARLVDYFHGDFIKLISHFRTCDKYNLGVITAHEFRSGIERRLGYPVSEKQWEQLQIDVGKDQDGLIPYTKFLQLFDIIPGSWNRKQEDGAFVTQIPQGDLGQTQEVEKLREKARVAMVPQEPERPRLDNTRTLSDVIKLVEEMFRHRFHTFDKEIVDELAAVLYKGCAVQNVTPLAAIKDGFRDRGIKVTTSKFQNFKEMDRKMVGRMSKWQLGALLKLSGLTLTPKEVDQLWATLNVASDGMYSYSSLIKQFVQFKAKGVEQKDEKPLGLYVRSTAKVIYGRERLRRKEKPENTKELVEQAKRVQRERKERKRAEQEAKENKETAEEEPQRATSTLQQTPLPNQKQQSRLSQYPPPGSSMSVMSTKSVRTKELLIQIKSDVVKNWEGLKSVFKFIDKSGFATITSGEMKDVMNTMKFSLTLEEKDELCQRFDLQRNGRFHYLEFMKCFSQRPNNGEKAKTFVYSKHTHKLEKKQNGVDITVACVISDMREKLMKEYKNLRRAFKKLDLNRNGYLSVTEFRKALRQCNVDVSNEDFYHLMTEFDKDITGRISYDNFLTTFVDV